MNDQQKGRKARHSSKSWMKTTVEPSPNQWELIATWESSIPSLQMCSSIPQQLPFSSPSPWKQIYTWKGGGSLGLDHPTDLLIKGTGAGFTQWLSTMKLNPLKTVTWSAVNDGNSVIELQRSPCPYTLQMYTDVGKASGYRENVLSKVNGHMALRTVWRKSARR